MPHLLAAQAPPVDLPTPFLWLLALGALALALSQIGRLVSPVARWVGGVVREALNEVIDARLEPVLYEMQANGGESVKDRVKKIHDRTQRSDDLLQAHIKASEADRADLRQWATVQEKRMDVLYSRLLLPDQNPEPDDTRGS